MAVSKENEKLEEDPWKMYFDGASNALGHGIGVILISPRGKYYPFTARLSFDCTNNVAEYETCVLGLHMGIERRIKVLKVYGDSALVIYQLREEWETRDAKLVRYRDFIVKLLEEFEDVSFSHLPRDENQMADALATLASMFRVSGGPKFNQFK